MIMNPTTPRSLSRLGRILVVATAAAVLPTLPVFAQVENESRNEELQQVLRQEREHRQKLEDVLEKLEQKHKELAERGKMDEAQQVEKEMKKIGRLQAERSVNEDPQSPQGGNQDELLAALKKAVHALHAQNDERAAATLAHYAEELAQRQHREAPARNQRPNGRDPRDNQFEWQENQAGQRGKAWAGNNSGQETEPKNFDGRWETKPDPTQRRVWDGKAGQQGGAETSDVRWETREPARQEAHGRQDHRLDELAEQVARLSKMVEQLAGRLQETDKTTRGR